ncbi:hypothetical protein ACSBR1_003121 [Camellia fascicularis]
MKERPFESCLNAHTVFTFCVLIRGFAQTPVARFVVLGLSLHLHLHLRRQAMLWCVCRVPVGFLRRRCRTFSIFRILYL